MPVLILFLLLGSLLSVPVPPAAGSSSGQGQPWYGSFAFRRGVQVSNPGPAGVTNYPILLGVSFTQSHLLSGSTELRIVNQNGIEVPSYIIDEATSGYSVSSALILFFVTMGANTSESLWLYYGDVGVNLPSYRVQSPAGSIGQGGLSVSLGSPAEPSSVQVGYGNTYFQGFAPSLSIGSAADSYGPEGLAASPLTESSPWHSVGSGLGSYLSAAASTFVAGQVRYSRVVVATNSSVTMVDAFLNQGSGPVQGLSFTLFVDDTQLATLGLSSTSYSSSGLVSSFTSGAYIQLAAPSPNSYEVGNETSVASQVLAGDLLGQSAATGPAAAALKWNLGTLASQGSATISETWGISSTPGEPATTGQTQAPQLTLGAEQTSPSFAPLASGIWETSVNVVNTPVPSSGITIPLTVRGTTILSNSAFVNGTVGYTVASGDFATGLTTGWQSHATSSGEGVAYASPAFWSVPEGRDVGRVAVATPDTVSAATASLTSGIGLISGEGQPELNIAYKANLTLASGNPSAQNFYAALEIGGTTNGTFDQTLVFPVAGTSAPVTGDSCGSAAGTGMSGLPHVTVVGYLIGDGTWRTLALNISKWITSAGAQVQLTFCSSASGSFEGQMELQLASVGVEVSAPARDYLAASVNPLTSTLTISQTRALGAATQQVTANLEVGFAVASASLLDQNQGGVFVSAIPQPKMVALNSSSTGKGSSVLPLSLSGMVFYTQFASLSPKLEVNGTVVAPLTVSNGAISTPMSLGLPSSSRSDPSFSLALSGYALELRAVDSNGNPAGGVVISLAAGQPPLVTSATTAADGSASFILFPGDYQLTATVQGLQALSSTVSVSSDTNTTLTVNLNSVIVRVLDALGGPVPDATVSISHGNFTKTGTTNSNGDYEALLVANGLYQLSAGTGGNNYYTGTISVSANNAVVSAKMQYYPLSVQLEVAGAVLAILLAAALLLYRPRKVLGGLRSRI